MLQPSDLTVSSGGGHHICGCHALGVIRLQDASGELRSMIRQDPEEDTLDTVLDLALLGGAAYLVYKIFLD